MLNLNPIVHAILEEYALPWDGTHGVAHWARVLENGLRLAQETQANIEVVQLFAIFHDSRRVNEVVDAGHGQRGADLAASFWNRWFTLSDHEFDLLHVACVGHTDGETNADITIQTCWDADRRICPDLRKLCTMAAKRPEVLKWADGRACFQVVPELVVKGWGIDTKDWRNG